MVVKALLDKLVQDVRPLQRQADAARDAGNWDEAARIYTEVVRIKPSAAAIWVQLGHAHKQSGRMERALEAYLYARKLQPADMDCALQLGHLYKLRGNVAAALASYQIALAGGLDDRHARHFVETAGPQLSSAAVPAVGKPAMDIQAAMYLDYSDLMVYFRNNRLPTGIQRVQIKLWQALMLRSSSGMPLRGCVFSEKVGFWVPLDPVGFSALCNLTAQPGTPDDADWRGALDQLDQHTASRRPIQFPSGSALVNFGASWWMPDYMAQVRAAKARYGVRYVPLIYDLIPLITPDYVSSNLTEIFATWASSVFMHADVVAAISSCTGHDVERYAKTAGLPVQPPIIMPLNADFEEAARPLSPVEIARRLDGFGLSSDQFVLFVGTLEARKNQLQAFKGWARLLEDASGGAVPTLVCVGKQGFGFDTLRAYLDARPLLAERVVLLSGVSDADLRALYAGCQFTVYTSTYEGWGLPVTESLCHGKVCLAGDHSSLPEAGGRFAVYCSSESVASFVEQARRLLFEPGVRQGLEAVIAAEFKPRQWSEVLADFAVQLETRLSRLPPSGSLVAPVTLGQRYRFGVAGNARLNRTAAVAEMMRTGSNWHGTENWGMWMREPVARLTLTFDSPAAANKDVIAYLTLRAAWKLMTVAIRVGPAQLATVEVPSEGNHLVCVVIPAEFAWAPATSGRSVVLQFVTRLISLSDIDPMDTRQVGIGVIDVTFCAADDVASRLTAIERSVMIVP